MVFETNPNGEQVAVFLLHISLKKVSEFIILTAVFSALRSQWINIVTINSKAVL